MSAALLAIPCGLVAVAWALAHVHPALLPLPALRFAYSHALLLDSLALLSVAVLTVILHRKLMVGGASARAWKRGVAAGVAVVVVAFSLRLIESWVLIPPRSADACAEQGGAWAAGGDGVFRCNPLTSDGGRACLDSTECQGRCLAPQRASAALAQAEPVGFCSGHLRAEGCPDLMRQGRAVSGCPK